MNMLIADSGGTKTDWAYVQSSAIDFFDGPGLHPAYNSAEQIIAEIETVINQKAENINRVFFYGAGCHGETPANKIKSALRSCLPNVEAEVFDDLKGAGRAHLQQTNGIIAALGTGSICGRYSKGSIIKRSAALGYAIGDEGSAADIGKAIIRAFFRDGLDEETYQEVGQKLGNKDYSYWMDKIYGSKLPNRELASVTGLVLSGDSSGKLTTILTGCFERFLNTQFSSLSPRVDEQIVFTGTVSNAHEDLLLKLLNERNFQNYSVRAGQIKGLVKYHLE